MLDFIKRAQKARDAAERIMGYRLAEYNDKVSALIFADIREYLQADIDWLHKVKKMSTEDQLGFVRATNSIEISQLIGGPKGDSRGDFSPLLMTEYSHRRGYYGSRTEQERAEVFLTSPVYFESLRPAPFTVPCQAFSSSRRVNYEDAVKKATREKLQKMRDVEAKPLMAEYKELVNNIHDTVAASPNWAKLLIAWPDVVKYLPELEPEPKMKAMIVRNTDLEAQIKKHQPPKKSKRVA